MGGEAAAGGLMHAKLDADLLLSILQLLVAHTPLVWPLLYLYDLVLHLEQGCDDGLVLIVQ